jgi:hypothetical protein
VFHDGGNKVIGLGYSPSSGNAIVAGKPAEIRWDPTNGGLSIGTDATSRVSGAAAALGRRLTILAGGNVGIGTTNPGALLETQANGTLVNSDSGQMRISGATDQNKRLLLGYDTTANIGWIQATQSGTSVRNLSLNPLGANVGIGTTSPGYTLHVNGSVAGNGAYIALSDIRFKKDVEDLVGSLAKVLAIRGVSYKWIDEERNGSGTQYGVIAQEIEKILPDVVVTGSDGIKRVKYDDLIPLIIEALKAEKASKDAEISQLKAESAQLKAESALLKASLCGKFADLPVCSN